MSVSKPQTFCAGAPKGPVTCKTTAWQVRSLGWFECFVCCETTTQIISSGHSGLLPNLPILISLINLVETHRCSMECLRWHHGHCRVTSAAIRKGLRISCSIHFPMKHQTNCARKPDEKHCKLRESRRQDCTKNKKHLTSYIITTFTVLHSCLQ